MNSGQWSARLLRRLLHPLLFVCIYRKVFLSHLTLSYVNHPEPTLSYNKPVSALQECIFENLLCASCKNVMPQFAPAYIPYLTNLAFAGIRSLGGGLQESVSGETWRLPVFEGIG